MRIEPPNRQALGPGRRGPAAPGEPTPASIEPTPHLSLPPRLLGREWRSDHQGPTLICVAAVHGNEPAGVQAVRRVLACLEEDPAWIEGHVVGVIGNRQALREKQRYLVCDLNRVWSLERLAALKSSSVALAAEDREQQELDETLRSILGEAQGKVYLLDIHSTSGPGPAFAILDDSLSNRRFAKEFPLPLVLGIEEELAGTLASYMGALGVTVVGLEAGQHEDPRAVDRAEAAIWVALEACGVVARGARSEVELSRRLLARESKELPRLVQVRYRRHVGPEDDFQMTPDLHSFEPVLYRQFLASTRKGEVRANRSGLVLMPLYQKQGDDGFFIATRVNPVWLWVSSVARSLGLDRYLHWLPGIRRHPNLPKTFVVDRRIARWLAPQLFHLLGFRRVADQDRLLIMTRRQD